MKVLEYTTGTPVMRFKPLDVRPFRKRLEDDKSYDIVEDRYWEADQTMSIYGDPELGTSVWDDVRSLEQTDYGIPLLPYVIRDKVPPIPERAVPPVPPPNTEPDLNYKIVIEVAGIKHPSSQRLYLEASQENDLAQELKTADTYRKDNNPYRSLVVFHNIPNIPRKLGLRIAMHGRGEPPLLLPLIDSIQPVPKSTDKDRWENIIIPVKPLGYITENQIRPEADVLPESGWIYVFWKNKLWRELQVGKHQTYRDTRLSYYRNTRHSKLNPTNTMEREALGTAYDSIWIPYKLNGEVQQNATGIKMMYSKRQLSWEEIDRLESMPSKLSSRATAIDALSIYETNQGFDLEDGPIGPIAPALLDQNPDVIPPRQNSRINPAQYLDRNRQNKISVAYLDATPRGLVVKFEYGIGKEKPKDQMLTLQADEGWSHTLFASDMEEIEAGWLQAVFEDYPEGATFDLIKDSNKPGVLPQYLFYDLTIEDVQANDQLSQSFATT